MTTPEAAGKADDSEKLAIHLITALVCAAMALWIGLSPEVPQSNSIGRYGWVKTLLPLIWNRYGVGGVLLVSVIEVFRSWRLWRRS